MASKASKRTGARQARADAAPAVSLRKMPEARFRAYHAESLETYSASIARSFGCDLPRAREFAGRQHRELLPDGLYTPDQHFFDVFRGEEAVGVLWVGMKTQFGERLAFIYEIEIFAKFQGAGLGKALLRAAEDFARAEKARKIGLHVFAGNDRARRLYASAKYSEVSLNLQKDLD